MSALIAGCVSGGQALVMLLILGTPFWIPLTGYTLQWACRIATVAAPDFDRALQVSFAEVIVGILILIAPALAYYYLAVDMTTSTGLVGLFTAGVAIVVPVGVYVPMMGVTYPKALLIAVMRYAFTLSIPGIAFVLFVGLVALADSLTGR